MNERLQQAARLYAARDYAAAASLCHAIIHDDPRHFDALHLLGVLLTLQQRPAEAILYLRRAEAEQPDQAQLRVNLGNALLAEKRFAEVVALPPAADAAAWNNLGLAHRGLTQDDAAAQAFGQATQIRPDFAPGWFNLAATLVRLNRLEEALEAARTALRVSPATTPAQRLSEIINEIGRTLVALGRPEEALAVLRRFLQRHPEQKTVAWNLSLCLLLLGRFDEGWLLYENRFDVPEHDRRPEGAIVLDPDRVRGKRVLILTEQGRGDMLQFIRYAPLLAERGATVFVQAYPDLVPLLAAMQGVTAVVSTDAPRPAADLVTSVLSLPLAFGIHPATVPYLRVPPERRTRPLGPSDRPRVGIAWSGSPHSYARSAMPAEVLAPLLDRPEFEFHCLQTDMTETDRRWLNVAKPAIIRHEQALRDFADTAALIDQLDSIVTIDTAVAHLAGGLAKPVRVMLPFSPDWRWMLDRNDSPWYPTARLFRQPARGAWEPMVRALIADLIQPS